MLIFTVSSCERPRPLLAGNWSRQMDEAVGGWAVPLVWRAAVRLMAYKWQRQNGVPRVGYGLIGGHTEVGAKWKTESLVSCVMNCNVLGPCVNILLRLYCCWWLFLCVCPSMSFLCLLPLALARSLSRTHALLLSLRLMTSNVKTHDWLLQRKTL